MHLSSFMSLSLSLDCTQSTWEGHHLIQYAVIDYSMTYRCAKSVESVYNSCARYGTNCVNFGMAYHPLLPPPLTLPYSENGGGGG